MSVEDGYGIGDGSTGNINADINQIEITGIGSGLAMTASGHMHFVGSIVDDGYGCGIYVHGTSTIGVVVDHCECNMAYCVGPNATLDGLFASITGSRTGTGTKNITIAGVLEQQPQDVTFALPLRGVSDAAFNFLGELRTVASGEVGDYATDFPLSNNHLSLQINSLTGSGDITITGTSLSESTAIPITGDTEVLTIDATGRYQTDKKWWEVTNIDIPVGISAIDYDIEVVGYPDFGNTDFRLVGYRVEAYAQGNDPDFGFEIYKVQDNGNKKWELVTLESIGVDANNAGNQIVDSLRAGANDRSYNPSSSDIWLNDTTFVFKQFDFDSYFSNDENKFESSTKNEGIIVSLRGEDGAGGGTITNVDHIQMFLRIGTIL